MSEIANLIPPSMIIGATAPSGRKLVSPEAQDVVDRLKSHYLSLGRTSAAQGYSRHLKSFFSWAETRGLSIRALPPEAVETFLTDLQNAGQKESTAHVIRSQLRGALRDCNDVFGMDFGHLEYLTGKPRATYNHQKAREKVKRRKKRTERIIAQAEAIMAVRDGLLGKTSPTPTQAPETLTFSPVITEEPTMSAPIAPDLGPTNTVTLPPMPSVSAPPNLRPLATIGNPRAAGTVAAGNTATGTRGMTIGNHVFAGPYVRISRMADGTDPLTPPGTETYITTVPLTQLMPHGDVAAYLQSFVIPNLRLSPMVTQVHFVFHELNERRQPTGRRDELVVSLPLTMGTPGALPAISATPAPVAYGAPSMTYQQPPDRAADYLMKKLDEDASDAKRRAEDLQDKLRETKDSQTTFMLQQQFQREQDLRRELEDRKLREVEAAKAAQYAAMYASPAPVALPPEPVRDSGAEMARAFAESQARMMEAMMTGIAASRNAPQPAVQKDAAEWLVPFMAQMNQQSMQQQQSQQSMLVQIMQANQQFMQALVTRESPELKILMTELKEVKAAANAPKEDEMEAFADKLQKMKLVSDMLSGGNNGGGGSSLIGELLANAEAIGEGAAKIISASKSRVTLPTGTLAGGPTGGGHAGTQASGPQETRALTVGTPQSMPPVPDAVNAMLDLLISAAGTTDDQKIIDAVTGTIGAMLESPEPFPRMANRLLLAFREMDDKAELYTFTKTLFLAANRKADKDVCKTVAAVLATWYEVIHEQLFGAVRKLGETVVETEAADEDADGEDSEDNEDTVET